MVLPAFSFLLTTLFPMRAVNDPKSRKALAAGAFILMRAETFRELGGYESIRRAVTEDLRTAQMFKQGGRKIFLAPTRGLIVQVASGWGGDQRLPKYGDFISQGREIASVVSLDKMQVKLELDQPALRAFADHRFVQRQGAQHLAAVAPDFGVQQRTLLDRMTTLEDCPDCLAHVLERDVGHESDAAEVDSGERHAVAHQVARCGQHRAVAELHVGRIGGKRAEDNDKQRKYELRDTRHFLPHDRPVERRLVYACRKLPAKIPRLSNADFFARLA